MKLKHIFFVIGFIMLLAAAFFVAAYFDLDWQYTVAIVLSIFSLILLIFLIKKYSQRRRNREFVRKIIAEDEHRANTNYADTAPERFKSFVAKIKAGIKSILINKNKDPFYTLPCFCFLGNKDSGKTAFLNNPKLTSSLTDMEVDNDKKDHNWWFFENLLALEISGQYTQAENGYSVRNEWENILRLIHKYRTKNLLNGIVVTISVDSLMNKDESTLIDDSVFMRKRIDQIMKTVGVNTPIYLMVTKIDKLMGLDDLLANLDKSLLQETLGYTNEDFKIKTNELFENKLLDIFDKLGNKFQNLYANFILKNKRNTGNAHQFLNEFELLNSQLFIYVKTLFRQNNYQYTPKFRGIYYSSATNTGVVNSIFHRKYLKDTKISADQKNGYFVEKFLTKKLVEDKHLFNYLSEFIVWKKVIKHLWVLIYIGVISSLSIFFYLSYVENKNILDEGRAFQSISIDNNLGVSIRQLYDQYISIKITEEKLNDTLVSGISFDYAKDVHVHQKKSLVSAFNKHIRDDLSLKLGEALKGGEDNFYQGGSYDIVMSYLILNINVNNQLRLGEKILFNKGDKRAITDFLNFLGLDSLDLSYKFVSLYEQYLNWMSSTQGLRKREIVFNQQFNELINIREGGFNWLVTKVLTNLDDITIKTFWVSIEDEYLKDLNSDYKLVGAYTEQGRLVVEQYIATIVNTLKEKKGDPYIDYFTKTFWVWYEKSYVESWERFLKNFPKAVKDYSRFSQNNFKQLLTIISHDNPYSLLVKFSTNELNSTKSKYKKVWIDDLLTLNRYLLLVGANRTTQDNQETLLKKAQKKFTKNIPIVNQKQADIINTATLLTDYYQSLGQLSIKDGDMYSNIQKFFSPDDSESKFEETYLLFNKFNFSAKNTIKNDFVLDLISTSLHFIIDYAINEESCALNEKWTQQVFYKPLGETKAQIVDELFNEKEGYVRHFIDQNISQYIGLLQSGYVGKSVHQKHQMPFTDDFFSFVNTGLTASKLDPKGYNIEIETRPIFINNSATVRPHLASITANCFGKNIQIDNFNFRAIESIKWIPANCKDAKLKISFEEFDLTKPYEGHLSLAHLIDDIKNKKLSVTDFPDQKDIMRQNNIFWIDAGFLFKGDVGRIINLVDPILDEIPNKILRCVNDAN